LKPDELKTPDEVEVVVSAWLIKLATERVGGYIFKKPKYWFCRIIPSKPMGSGTYN